MKTSLRAILTIFALSIYSIALGQSGYVYSEQFDDCLISSRSIFVCSDNSVVVLGNLDDNYGPWTQYLTITKLDPTGNLLWRQWMGGTTLYLTITGVDIDENDTVTFITTVLDSDQYIQLWSIDDSGDLTLLSDEPYICNPRAISFNKAIHISSGDIIAVGQTNNTNENKAACYYRFSASGDTLATAYWQLDTSSPYPELGAEAFDLALNDNGNILITCQLSIGTASVLEVDVNGNIINRIDAPETLYCEDSNVAISPLPNNEGYLVTGPFGEYPDTTTKAYLLHNGELTYCFDVNPSIVQWPHSTFVHENGIVICGLSSARDAILASFSSVGESNWIWQEDGENTCNYMLDGIGNASATLLVMDSDDCVYWAWGGWYTQVITKLLPNGQLPVSDEVQSPPATMISAFPNPMKDEIRIKIKQDTQVLSQVNGIDIFNIKGQLIRSLELTKGETVWDGKDNGGKPSPRGIYLLRSNTKTKQLIKIVKTR